MASGRRQGVDPRREKLLDFRHRGGSRRCRCWYCLIGRAARRIGGTARDERRRRQALEADDE